jgi:hypothetical protein
MRANEIEPFISKYVKEYSALNTNELTRLILDNEPKLDMPFMTLYYHVQKARSIVPVGEKGWNQLVNEEIKTRKFKVKHDEIENKYNVMLRKYEQLEHKYNALIDIKTEPASPIEMPEVKRGKSEATAIVQYSDWHVEEEVKESHVDGLNKYNLEICEKRAATLFRNTITLIDKERTDIDIPNIIIHLGGDFATGWIHPEGMQTNLLSPVEAIIFARNILHTGLDFIVNNGKFKRIIVVCSHGNHTRLTPKMQYSNGPATNLETFIYHDLKDRFNKHIEFVIPESDIVYFDIYNRRNRFFHGHQVKYNNGVGGITPSLNKKEASWDKTTKASYNFMCHFHSWSFPNRDTTMNGSLIGWTAFPRSLGFPFEPPLQNFQLLDSVRGYTVRCPILCE